MDTSSADCDITEDVSGPNSEVDRDKEAKNWWNPIYSAFQSKSEKIINNVNYLHRDVAAVASVVENHANNVLSTGVNLISDTFEAGDRHLMEQISNVGDKVSSFFYRVNEALTPNTIDDDDEVFIICKNKPVSITKLQSKIYLLSSNQDTFLKDIEEDILPRFNAWVDFVKNTENNLFSEKNLTDMLVSNSRLGENYSQLVPEMVSHTDFWNRFLFRKALLEDEFVEIERKKQAAELKMKVVENDLKEIASSSALEISEEEQEKILVEYEKEVSTGKGRQAGIGNKNYPATNEIHGDTSVARQYQRESSSDVTISSDVENQICEDWIKVEPL